MGTVDDIQFSDIYSFLHRALFLLYDRSGSNSPMRFQTAHRLTCLRPFDNLNDYQNYIEKYNPTKITLCASSRKIQNWDDNYRLNNDKLLKLITYCRNEDEKGQMRDWNGRHRWESKEVILMKKLDFQLLLSAASYIEAITDELDGADGLRDILETEGQQISQLIGEHFANRRTRTSEEARDNII